MNYVLSQSHFLIFFPFFLLSLSFASFHFDPSQEHGHVSALPPYLQPYAVSDQKAFQYGNITFSQGTTIPNTFPKDTDFWQLPVRLPVGQKIMIHFIYS